MKRFSHQHQSAYIEENIDEREKGGGNKVKKKNKENGKTKEDFDFRLFWV